MSKNAIPLYATLLAATATGCATARTEYASPAVAMEALGDRDVQAVKTLPGKYLAEPAAVLPLHRIAGIYTRTVAAVTDDGTPMVLGEFDADKYPESLEQAAYDADNGDGVITEGEAKSLLAKLHKENATDISEFPSVDKAISVLGTDELAFLPGGYTTSTEYLRNINPMVALLDGKAVVYWVGKQCGIEGDSEPSPDLMKMTAKMIDRNPVDKILEFEEIVDASYALCKAASPRTQQTRRVRQQTRRHSHRGHRGIGLR